MTTEHQPTQEEKAYGQFLDETWETLSAPARIIIGEAQSAAYAASIAQGYCFQWHFEYDEAMDRMRLAATELTDREHKVLAKLCHAALAAATSLDSEDVETPAGYRVYRGHLHSYYKMLSSMVEDTLPRE
jgi:hypothetical protein